MIEKSILAIVLFERKKARHTKKKKQIQILKTALDVQQQRMKNSGVKNFMLSENIVSCNSIYISL